MKFFFDEDPKHKEEEMDINSLYALYTRRAVGWTAIILSAFTVFLMIAATVKANSAESKEHTRIVSIGGSLTEIVYALGEQDRLIARDTTSIFPKDVFSLPDVGYIRQLSPEGVLSVDPDLILALEGSGPPETIDTLKAAKVPIVFVPEGYTDQKIQEKILAVGDALGARDKAVALAQSTSDALARVAEKATSANEAKKVLFILSLQGGKVLASGRNTGADGIIKMAGGENVISDFEGYRQISDEAVITAKPDVILMMQPRANHGSTNEEVLRHPAILSTPAGQYKKIVRMDGLYLLGFGPRTADAALELHKKLRDN